MGMTVSAVVVGHWFNYGFLRIFGRPYLVVDGREHAVEWGRPVEVQLPDRPVPVGAGVRYREGGALLGHEPQTYDRHVRTQADGVPQMTFRNGFWNHTPFRLVR